MKTIALISSILFLGISCGYTIAKPTKSVKPPLKKSIKIHPKNSAAGRSAKKYFKNYNRCVNGITRLSVLSSRYIVRNIRKRVVYSFIQTAKKYHEETGLKTLKDALSYGILFAREELKPNRRPKLEIFYVRRIATLAVRFCVYEVGLPKSATIDHKKIEWKL